MALLPSNEERREVDSNDDDCVEDDKVGGGMRLMHASVTEDRFAGMLLTLPDLCASSDSKQLAITFLPH